MYDKVVTALEPFGLTLVVISGLILTGRITVGDRGMIGYVVIFVGAALIVNHVVKQIRGTSSKKSKKE